MSQNNTNGTSGEQTLTPEQRQARDAYMRRFNQWQADEAAKELAKKRSKDKKPGSVDRSFDATRDLDVTPPSTRLWGWLTAVFGAVSALVVIVVLYIMFVRGQTGGAIVPYAAVLIVTGSVALFSYRRYEAACVWKPETLVKGSNKGVRKSTEKSSVRAEAAQYRERTGSKYGTAKASAKK